MDFQLMQWRNQQQRHQSDHQQMQQQVESDRKHNHQQQQQQHHHQSLSALPLFLTEPVSKVGNLSVVHPDMPFNSKFPKMMMMGGGGGGQQLSSSQWQELELQAVIFRYMLAGASVPAELLQPIKNSLLNSSSFFLHHPLQHFPIYQPATTSLQSGYWGRAGMDPEPGRCRRTDGKKWRCSRDVAPGHKYCERHMNRGRNRSRKPVELPRSRTDGMSAVSGEELLKTADPVMVAAPLGAGASRSHFSSFGGVSPSSDILHLSNHHRSPFEPNHGGGSDGRVLRRFFDDWPKTMAEHGSRGMNGDQVGSSTSLSMSIRGNSASDVSLKLSTGSGNEDSSAERDGMQLNWMAQWGQHQAGPMGGPLAEALRSSATHN